MSISYEISLYDAFAHIYQVTCSFKLSKKETIKFSLPDWIPGSYMIREFSKNIIELKAYCDNKEIKIEQLQKSKWQLPENKGSIEIVSKVYAFDYSVRACFFDQNHAYFNGTSLFFKIQGFDNTVHNLTINKSTKEQFKKWIVGTSLQKETVDKQGFGNYKANNYNDLIEHPVEIADQVKFNFDANGIKHDVYIQGKHETNIKKLRNDLKTICEYELNLFDKPYPIDRYVFLFWIQEEGYGGLEHKYSTSLMVSRKDLINQEEEKSESYIMLLGLCSHEYFHTWNIKRLKPQAYLDNNLNQEAYTKLLWWFEGVTSYYDDLILLKSGIITLDEYLILISKTFNRVLLHTGKNKQSIADSSFNTWNKFYKQNENAPNAIVSYYTKGAMVAFALDLTIQQQSKHQYSLTDLLQYLWKNFGIKQKGLNEFQIEETLLNTFNLNLKNFFDNYIYGTKEPEYKKLIKTIGLQLKKQTKEEIDIGVMVKNNNGMCQLTQVFENQVAIKSGLTANDTLVAINNIQVTFENWQELLNQFKNKTISIYAFRQKNLFKTKLKLRTKKTKYHFSSFKPLSKEQEKNRRIWLK